MVKVAIGGFQHETNTYAADVFGFTTRRLFSQVYGERILKAFAKTKIPIGGFIAAAKELKYDVVPTFYCNATPSGTIKGEDYEYLKNELVSSIANVMPVDAVAIELHGAGVSEGCEDIESDIGKALRAVIGPNIPLICSLDLHGNIYDEMLQYWDGMIGYRLYPHEDQFETGYKVFKLLPQLLKLKNNNVNNNDKLAIKLKRLPVSIYNMYV
jgi:microcystin degradation protein MlrC